MKLSARMAKLRKRKPAHAAADSRPPFAVSASTWVLLGLCLALGGVGTLAVYEFFIWTKVPPELVGLWEVDEGPQKGGTFEFFRDGTMEVLLKAKGKTVTHKTQVSVRGKTLFMTTRDPLTREESTNEGMIRELTRDTLIVELERGDVLKMMRIE
jgi:hypothetical protein